MNTIFIRKSISHFIIAALTLLLVTIPLSHIQAAAVMDSLNAGQTVAGQTTIGGDILDVGWVYTAGATYTLGRIEGKFAVADGSVSTIEFYTAPPSLGGTLLTSGTFTPTAPAPAGTNWEGANLNNTVSIVSGNSYFVAFKNIYSSPTSNVAGVAPQLYYSLGTNDYSIVGTGVDNNNNRPIIQFFSADAPTITSAAPANGTQGTAYSHSYTANGNATITYSVTTGALPTGLTLSTAGVISGTPSASGTFTGVVTATNGVAPDATQNFSITIAAAPTTAPTITSAAPTNGTVGTGYNHTYTATGSATITYSVTAGALPTGLSLSAAGVISGTPTATGTFTGTVTATNGTAPDSTQNFSITIAAATVAPTITSAAPTNGTVGTGYNHTYTATGSATITYSVTAGALPTSLSLSTAGVISGTPTATGTFTGTVTATNGTAPDATQNFSITIAAATTAPTITSAAPTNGTVGTGYNHTYTATGSATITYSVTAGALPTGLSLSTAGVISGTPTATGTFTGTVTATNGTAPDTTQNFSITIAGVAPTITSAAPSAGVQGTGYNHTYTATGSGTITYSVTAGALPTGLSLSTAGVISGTPTATGTFTGTVTATNGTAPDATQNFSITISATAVAPTITSAAPVNGTIGSAYSHTYTATGTATITYSVTAGALPTGLSLSSAGVISGTPSATGTFTGTVTATNGTAPDATQNFSITIASVAPTITSAAPGNGTVGSAYSYTYTATGTATITYSVTAGALPTGLSLSSAGVISGTPTATGTFTGTVTATNGTAPDATQNFSITINAAGTITLSPATLPNGTVGTAYSQNITAAGGTGSYTYAVTVGALPTGLTLSPAGVFSGTPTAAATFNFTVTATDSILATGSQAYTVVISPSGTPPVVTQPVVTHLPDPPPAPACTDTNFEENGMIRTHFTNDADRAGLSCRLMAANGSYMTWLGSPITNSGMIGSKTVLDLGIVAAADVFSGNGQSGFVGDVNICLKGSGYMIYMNANTSPRVPQLWSAWKTDAFPGYTCTTLYAPGTVILVTNKP